MLALMIWQRLHHWFAKSCMAGRAVHLVVNILDVIHTLVSQYDETRTRSNREMVCLLKVYCCAASQLDKHGVVNFGKQLLGPLPRP